MRAHNRWLADFCAEAPERRAGIGLIHLNNIDDAIADVEWVARQNLRGDVLLPLPADVRQKSAGHALRIDYVSTDAKSPGLIASRNLKL